MAYRSIQICLCHWVGAVRGGRATVVGHCLTTSRTQALRDLQQSNQALLQSFRQTIGALASAVLHRDPGAATHQRRVAALAVAVGQKLGLSGLRLEGLEMAALIHDIGQIEDPC